MGVADDITYHIHGSDMQFVEIELDPNESVVAENGAMMYMDQTIHMETILGDGSPKTQGLFGKIIGIGRRKLTKESLFMAKFTNQGHGPARVAFTGATPGKIIPIELTQAKPVVMCQAGSFLCAARGIAIRVGFHRKLGATMFGGEGLIMQKLEGIGLAFIQAGGTLYERQLASGEEMRVDTGSIVGYEATVSFDAKMVSGFKNNIFGGEGFFLSHLTGPGKVWLQSMPYKRLIQGIHSQLIKLVKKG